MELSPFMYQALVDPLLKNLRNHVIRLTDTGSRVVDIACGTGDLAFMLAARCSKVVGVDIYEPMINYARDKKKENGFENTEFYVADASDLSPFGEDEFDLATMSLAFHQFDSNSRAGILSEALRISPRLIIADYAEPIASGFFRAGVHLAERMAGASHYRNFRSFGREGGSDVIAGKSGYRVIRNEISGSGVFAITEIYRPPKVSPEKTADTNK